MNTIGKDFLEALNKLIEASHRFMSRQPSQAKSPITPFPRPPTALKFGQNAIDCIHWSTYKFPVWQNRARTGCIEIL